jgi:hypothetical protein
MAELNRRVGGLRNLQSIELCATQLMRSTVSGCNPGLYVVLNALAQLKH